MDEAVPAHQEFLPFLRRVDRDAPADLDVHCIVDNYSTHKHPGVRGWLKRTLINEYMRHSNENPKLLTWTPSVD